MKHTLLAFLLAAVSLFAAEPWPGVQYSEVRAFAWDLKIGGGELIHKDMTFADGVINKDGAVLNADQVKRLIAAQVVDFEVVLIAGCYTPHNAFVFYNADKKPVAFLEVCFDCLGTRSAPDAKKYHFHYPKLAKICDELKLPLGHEKTLGDYYKKVSRMIIPARMLK